LHFSENSLDMSPNALSAAKSAIEHYGNRYPSASVDEFREKLAEHHQVKSEQLIFVNGLTEVLQAIATFAVRQNATMIEPSPTFGALKEYCKAENLNVIQVPDGQKFEMNSATLNELELESVPSDSNFILHRIGTPLADYAEHMQYINIA
jgi:histidinol-phosphate aminotransferase